MNKEGLFMQKKRAPETALVSSIADSLMDALPVFHKHLLGVDTLQRTHHMPLSHLQILLMLRGSDMSIGEISLRLGIAKPNITPLVDALCEEGLVERIRDMLDRRVVNVHLLPAGQERLAALQDSMMEQVDQWAGKLSRSELREMNNALASILRILEAVRENS